MNNGKFYLTAWNGYHDLEAIGGLNDVVGYFDDAEEAIAWHIDSDYRYGEVFSVIDGEVVVHAYVNCDENDSSHLEWIREPYKLYAHKEVRYMYYE